MQRRNVIVVGAGPVGTVAALACARRGLSVTLLEAQARVDDSPRASTTQPPTLEILAELGLIDEYLRVGIGDAGIDLRIAAADPLLRFLERLHFDLRDRARFDYFRGGWSAHRLLRQILRLRFGAAAESASILDFGSGFGRTTRFLLRDGPGLSIDEVVSRGRPRGPLRHGR